ncbi:MAG: transcriptional regulator [Methylophaga sp.]|uniref:BolA family protein n=1 Tax=unclassified Methylophaga TaxID=2629249 RepID=UPI000C4E0B45|nr:BolA family protein [Methylophaga sp. UBA678]MAX52955.1 transcriptional regulator [Methylophaga sp.]|tara:strand:- start:57301 stop:57567 length:267 start_codon:yes stop_codon:yes gene_type:complete
MSTIDDIKTALQALSPELIEIEDDSDKHAGHAGNTGGGHYNVLIVSNAFSGLTLIKRHRLVFEQVESLMKSKIHALSIQAKTPAEYHV